MTRIESVLAASARAPPTALLRAPRPGDGAFYAAEYGFDASFEGLVAEIAAKFLASFDASRERCWIADAEGAQVGSVFLVRHSDEVAKLRLLLVDPAGRGQGLGRRLAAESIAFARQLRLPQDHAVDPEHPGCCAQNLSGPRLRADGERAAPQLWPKPDRRDLGARTVTSARRDPPRRVTIIAQPLTG